MPQNPIRIDWIGAGAIARRVFLPALKGTSNVVLTSFVDTDANTVVRLSKHLRQFKRLVHEGVDYRCFPALSMA